MTGWGLEVLSWARSDEKTEREGSLVEGGDWRVGEVFVDEILKAPEQVGCERDLDGEALRNCSGVGLGERFEDVVKASGPEGGGVR